MDIKQDSIYDPIRIIRINAGKHTGLHKMYISEKIFRKDYPKEKIYFPYYNADSINQWCMTDDGWIIQLLELYCCVNKGYKQENVPGRQSGHIYTQANAYKLLGNVVLYKFACRRCRVIWHSDSTVNASRFFGCALKMDDGHITENYNPLGKYMNPRKRHLITLMVAGASPVKAYMDAYNRPYNIAKTHAYRLIVKDPMIIEELGRHMKENIIDDLDKQEMSGDYLLQQMKNMIEDEKTTANVKAGLIMFLTKIRYHLTEKTGYLPDINDIRKAGGRIDMDTNPGELKDKLIKRVNGEQ